jgi:glycosyltransferase involved in cell wall biosynthesis
VAKRKKKKGGGTKGSRPLRPHEIAAGHRANEQQQGAARMHSISSAREFLRKLQGWEGDPLVTFIVPTKGRPSLKHAVRSLVDQTNPRWRAIVMGDGIDPDTFADARIDKRTFFLRGMASHSAGLTRNAAISFAIANNFPTPWLAFLDDDDELTSDYVQRLEEETQTPRGEEAGVVVFRMHHPELGILPPLDMDDAAQLRWGQVGISFAVRTPWFWPPHSLRFIRERPSQPSQGQYNEDIDLLLRLRDKLGAVVHLSPALTYRVRPQQGKVKAGGF